ncbi:hypothetical protein Tco_1250092 [Tanacetum coccineum]
MAALKSCPKHNMVTYLENTNGNTDFHKIISFLTQSSIHYALTAIFDAIQLMGYEGDLTVLTFNKALFSPQWRFLFHTMNHCISSTLERQSEAQPIPSPPHPSTDQHETQTNPSLRPSPTTHILDSIPEGSGGNHGG